MARCLAALAPSVADARAPAVPLWDEIGGLALILAMEIGDSPRRATARDRCAGSRDASGEALYARVATG